MRAWYRPPDAPAWRRPGGPWDGPTLDRLPGLERVVDPEAVARTVGTLAARGARPGAVVSWPARNRPADLTLLVASWRLGAVAAPRHPRAGPAETAAFLDALAATRARLVELGEVPPAGPLPLPDADGPPRGGSAARGAQVAVALATGGTTGETKVVLHTHRSLSYTARTAAAFHRLGPDDTVLMPAPLAHVSGLLNGLLVPAAVGMRVTLMERWDPDDALGRIADHRVTFMVGPPTFFRHLMDAPGFTPERVRSLRLVSCGGAGVTAAFVEEAAARLGAVVKRSYGSTEAPTVTSWAPGDPPGRAAHTDGRPIGAARVRLGDDGELWVRGPGLFAGYTDRAATAAAIHRGWFRTGDLATIDDGWVTITGRTKAIIIRGGENVAVAEVEAVLAAHPRVRDAVVVGVPDPEMGERVGAFVVADEGFDLAECRAWFAARGVARFKTPERLVRLARLPLLPNGKPDRRALLARLRRPA